jgi:hypothetical protein
MQIEILLIILLLVNLILQVILLSRKNNENWSDGFGGSGDDKDDYGQLTYSGCNCSKVSTKTNQNAPFNDDSFLYKNEMK